MGGSLGGVRVFSAGAAVNPVSYLDSSVLLLNAHYMAMRVVSVRRAFTLLFKRDHEQKPIAEIVSV